MAEWRYISTHSQCREDVEVSGQPQGLAALLPREGLSGRFEWGAAWPPEPVWRFGEEKNLIYRQYLPRFNLKRNSRTVAVNISGVLEYPFNPVSFPAVLV